MLTTTVVVLMYPHEYQLYASMSIMLLSFISLFSNSPSLNTGYHSSFCQTPRGTFNMMGSEICEMGTFTNKPHLLKMSWNGFTSP